MFLRNPKHETSILHLAVPYTTKLVFDKYVFYI